MKRLMDWIAGRCGYVPAFLEEDRLEMLKALGDCLVQRDACRKALKRIIAQDTPNGNATVKRMVKLARDGLGGA